MKRGFTLIELLVVVLIIGILSAVALPQYRKAVERSKMSEAISNIGQFRKALEVWIMANGKPSVAVNFIGNENWSYSAWGGGFTQTDLDIDLKQALECPEGDKYCYSKNFKYLAWCNPNLLCRFQAIQRNGDYTLAYRYEPGFEFRECYPGDYGSGEETFSSFGIKVCKSLDPELWDCRPCRM